MSRRPAQNGFSSSLGMRVDPSPMPMYAPPPPNYARSNSAASHALWDGAAASSPSLSSSTDCLSTGEAHRVQYSVNGRQYDTGYYLADGIYPEWATFVKTIPLPQNDKHKLFAKIQEGARKDVERAFAALQSRFSIVNRPAKFWKRAAVGTIMQACVILHNMIVEDERKPFNIPLDLNRNPEISSVLPPEVVQGTHPVFEDVLRRSATIRDRETHIQLKLDLVENIWDLFGKK
ncbi:unnamed protein product [Alopecurus aequalis]